MSRGKRLKTKFILWLKFLSRIPFTTFGCGRVVNDIFGKYYAGVDIKSNRYGYHGYTIGCMDDKLYACIIASWLGWAKDVWDRISFIWRKWE